MIPPLPLCCRRPWINRTYKMRHQDSENGNTCRIPILQVQVCYIKVVCKRVVRDCSEKLRNFSTGFMRPRKVDTPYTYEVLIFTKDYNIYLICIDILW